MASFINDFVSAKKILESISAQAPLDIQLFCNVLVVEFVLTKALFMMGAFGLFWVLNNLNLTICISYLYW